MQQAIDRIFAISTAIRYVAIYHHGQLTSAVRPGLQNASASESDKYEELLVNPTLLTLARQRGDIDCGGLQFIVIGYGSFFELVWPLASGHISVGIEPSADPLAFVSAVREIAWDLPGTAASSERG